MLKIIRNLLFVQEKLQETHKMNCTINNFLIKKLRLIVFKFPRLKTTNKVKNFYEKNPWKFGH